MLILAGVVIFVVAGGAVHSALVIAESARGILVFRVFFSFGVFFSFRVLRCVYHNFLVATFLLPAPSSDSGWWAAVVVGYLTPTILRPHDSQERDNRREIGER
jgi:hypothetical protein